MSEQRTTASPLIRPLKATSRADGAPTTERRLDATDPNQVASGLLGYLRARHPGLALRFLESPTYVPNGWETHMYRFQLQAVHALPPEWTGPLVLRIYASPQGGPRARHEFAVQRFLRSRAFRVPRPVLLESSWRLFGGPFLVFERLPGRTFFEVMLRQPYRVWGCPTRMAALHARLHLVSPEGFPAPRTPFLDRQLADLRTAIRQPPAAADVAAHSAFGLPSVQHHLGDRFAPRRHRLDGSGRWRSTRRRCNYADVAQMHSATVSQRLGRSLRTAGPFPDPAVVSQQLPETPAAGRRQAGLLRRLGRAAPAVPLRSLARLWTQEHRQQGVGARVSDPETSPTPGTLFPPLERSGSSTPFADVPHRDSRGQIAP
jgi:Phosphotransferase enzyme family